MPASQCYCGLGHSLNSPPVYVSGYGVQLRRNGQLPLDWVTGEEIPPGASGTTSCPLSKSTITSRPHFGSNDARSSPKINGTEDSDDELHFSFKKESAAHSEDELPPLTRSKSTYKQTHDSKEKPAPPAEKTIINFAGLVKKVRNGRLKDIKMKDSKRDDGNMTNDRAEDDPGTEHSLESKDSKFINGAFKKVRFVPAAAAAYESIGGMDHDTGLSEILEYPELPHSKDIPDSIIFENDDKFGPDIIVKQPIVMAKELQDQKDDQESLI